jgi:2'-5' RNA ligase
MSGISFTSYSMSGQSSGSSSQKRVFIGLDIPSHLFKGVDSYLKKEIDKLGQKYGINQSFNTENNKHITLTIPPFNINSRDIQKVKDIIDNKISFAQQNNKLPSVKVSLYQKGVRKLGKNALVFHVDKKSSTGMNRLKNTFDYVVKKLNQQFSLNLKVQDVPHITLGRMTNNFVNLISNNTQARKDLDNLLNAIASPREMKSPSALTGLKVVLYIWDGIMRLLLKKYK